MKIFSKLHNLYCVIQPQPGFPLKSQLKKLTTLFKDGGVVKVQNNNIWLGWLVPRLLEEQGDAQERYFGFCWDFTE